MTGDIIKQERKKKNLTQIELAKKVGISRNALINYEAGTRIPPINVQLKLADVLGIDILDLKDSIPQLNQIKNIINLVKNFISPEKIIVSILPGKSLQWLGTEIGKPTKLIRTMPNTPALVGEGMTGVCANDLVTEEELQLVLTLLKSFGRAEVVPEYLMDTVTGVSGSSPAYVFLFLEALADAAVAEGMPRKQAYEFAAQSVLGSAKMLLETGMHPGELKDMVCSPGGTTIEAVAVLERENLRSAVIDATRACIRKSKGVD